MTIVQNLMGLGMSGALAGQVGHTQSVGAAGAGIAGTGTAQVGATLLGTSATVVAPAAGNTAYILPASGNLVKEWYLFNPTAVAGVVFPPVGGSINGGAVNASVAIPANGYLQCVLAQNIAGVPQWFAK